MYRAWDTLFDVWSKKCLRPLGFRGDKFRAHDLDKNKAWAATIEDISPNRRPLHLAPDVRPDQLFDRKEVRADVLVTSVLDQDGEYTPSLYYLQKVYDAESPPSP